MKMNMKMNLCSEWVKEKTIIPRTRAIATTITITNKNEHENEHMQ